MNQNKCFGIIVKRCSSIPRAIRVFKLKTGLYIVMWNKCKLTVFEYTSNFISQNGNDVPMSDIKENQENPRWEFTLDHNIINVLQKNETLFVVDTVGILHQLDVFQELDMETNQLTEVDMFGGSPSPGISDHCAEWKLNKTGKLEDCDTVLAVCSVEHGFAVLAIKRGHLFLLVYKLLKCFPSVVIKIEAHNKQEVIRDGIMSRCLPKTLSPELRSGLLKDLESDDREILIIGLSNGEFMWAPVNGMNRRSHTVYYAVQPIQNFYWISDGESGLYSRLVIILCGGPVIIIRAGQKSLIADMLYLPSKVISSACIDNRIITTDAVDCLRNVLCLQEKLKFESSIFPVKGVTALCPIVDSKNLFLAGTLHHCLYYIDSEVTPTGDPLSFSMPSQSMLDELFNKIQQLEDVNKLMSKEDSYLKAISLTTRAHLLKNAFSINAKVFTGIDKRLVVFISISAAYKFIELSADVWCVNLQLCDSDNNSWSQTQYLQHNLTSQTSTVVEMNYTICVGSTLTCRFTAVIEENQPRLIIPAGEVQLDACYFLTPVSSLVCALPPNQEPDLNSVLLSLAGESEKVASQECSLSVKIPEDKDLSDVFSIIFKDSSHRMSVGTWQNINSGKRILHLLINKIKVQLNLDDATRTLTIGSLDINTNYQLKLAIVKRLSSDKDVQINESLILEAQAIMQTLEIEMLKETQSFEFYDSLRKRVRTEISSKLPL